MLTIKNTIHNTVLLIEKGPRGPAAGPGSVPAEPLKIALEPDEEITLDVDEDCFISLQRFEHIPKEGEAVTNDTDPNAG